MRHGCSATSSRSAAPSSGGSTAQAARRGARTLCRVWTRPTPDRNEDWVKPSYIPQPQQQPGFAPREEPRPLYSPAPEFRPAEAPDKQTEMPEGPKMPERRPDPIPAGNPKEKPSEGGGDQKREAPPAPSPDKK
ncbi:hypothetical protein MNEG_9303 [Monoraphidium neglectum]|uniref:Uncharacterized protein n=1 Tax=Monoraphidium neglectum TaxID=145388 RepID=A0A0D2M5D1_9CHLO|nr:hypothetical protein MNEG_9303 [Monoraphidium neglectum]KIY98659.1 hypothetical protein MNEG_9303 [Monoraphidium neglectum]|eukprot:XP_013897679.1 hypothetical protein MNEG_9303 [Monoraphidium neglectum]